MNKRAIRLTEAEWTPLGHQDDQLKLILSQPAKQGRTASGAWGPGLWNWMNRAAKHG